MRSLMPPVTIPRTIVIFVGGRSNAAKDARRPDYGVFSRPWREARPRLGSGATLLLGVLDVPLRGA